MPENTSFQKQLNPEECEECFRWFEERMDRLPPTFSTNSFKSANLPATVRRMITVLRLHLKGNPTYYGQYAILAMIRQRLLGQGL